MPTVEPHGLTNLVPAAQFLGTRHPADCVHPVVHPGSRKYEMEPSLALGLHLKPASPDLAPSITLHAGEMAPGRLQRPLSNM